MIPCGMVQIGRSDERAGAEMELVQLAFLFDGEGEVQSYSRSWLQHVGWRASDVAGGRAWLDAFHPDDRLHVREGCARARESRSSVTRLARLIGGDGRVSTYLCTFEPLEGAGGGFAALLVPTAPLEARDRALREAERQKDEFLAMLAHELRNPLAPLLKGLHFLTLSTITDPPIRRVRGMMDRQVRHLARLVDDLLEVSRITRGAIELRRETTSVESLLERAVETAQPIIDDLGHHLRVERPEEHLHVEVDPTRIAQAVANLLNNAAKYTERGGAITLAARRDGDAVLFEVTDSGVGMAPEFVPRVFDLFSQVSRGMDRAQGGLGIGLTLVRRLVELHGGTVSARSPGLGKGSTFSLRLPVLVASQAEEPAPPTRPQKAPMRRARILVVDDNVDMATGLAELLEMYGHTVKTEHDGPSALTAAERFRPEVVLLDLGLPGMDGYEVAHRLRTAKDGERLRLIAISGYGQDRDRRRSMAVGFDHHLVKPVDFDVLLGILAGTSLPERPAARSP